MAYVSFETQDKFTTPEGRLVCSADGGATHRYDLHTGNALYLAEAIIQTYALTESELLGLRALIDARLAVVAPPVEGEYAVMSSDKYLAEQIGEIAIHGYLKDAKVSDDGAAIELYVTRKFDAATSEDYDTAKTYLVQITPSPDSHIKHIRRFHDHWPSDRRVGEIQASVVVTRAQVANGLAGRERSASEFKIVLENSSGEVIETITGVNRTGGIDLTQFTVTVAEVPPSDPIIDTERYAGLSRSDLIARLAKHENAYVTRLGDD